MCLRLFLSLSLSLSLSIFLFLPFSLSVLFSLCLSACLSFSLSLCLSLSVSHTLSLCLYLSLPLSFNNSPAHYTILTPSSTASLVVAFSFSLIAKSLILGISCVAVSRLIPEARHASMRLSGEQMSWSYKPTLTRKHSSSTVLLRMGSI